MKKVGRNDPCPCGSGKKYKKCCEAKTHHRKFHAEVLTSTDASSDKQAQKISSFFKRNLPPTPLPSEKPEPEREEKLPM